MGFLNNLFGSSDENTISFMVNDMENACRAKSSK